MPVRNLSKSATLSTKLDIMENKQDSFRDSESEVIDYWKIWFVRAVSVCLKLSPFCEKNTMRIKA